MSLSKKELARVKELMSTLHSFAGLIEKIEQAVAKPDDTLERLQKELSRGLDVALELTKALNQTALDLHMEIMCRSLTKKG